MAAFFCSCSSSPVPLFKTVSLLTAPGRVAYLISAIFICLEYLRLGIFYRGQHRILFASFWIKLSFIVIEVALAIGFGVCHQHPDRRNASAVLEWGMSFN